MNGFFEIEPEKLNLISTTYKTLEQLESSKKETIKLNNKEPLIKSDNEFSFPHGFMRIPNKRKLMQNSSEKRPTTHHQPNIIQPTHDNQQLGYEYDEQGHRTRKSWQSICLRTQRRLKDQRLTLLVLSCEGSFRQSTQRRSKDRQLTLSLFSCKGRFREGVRRDSRFFLKASSFG